MCSIGVEVPGQIPLKHKVAVGREQATPGIESPRGSPDLPPGGWIPCDQDPRRGVSGRLKKWTGVTPLAYRKM